MPRKAGSSIPSYRKHRASGQAITTIAGVDHYLGPHGTKASKLEYDRLVGEWMAAGRPTVAAGVLDITIVELVKRYKAFAESYYKPTGTLDNIIIACRELRISYGTTAAASFGPLALKAVRQRFVDRGVSRTHCNRLTDMIRRLFKWGVGEQLVPEATWRALQAVAGLRSGHTTAHENAPIMPVDDALVESVLPFMSDTVAAMVRLQRLTGMRPDEVCRLRPADIDRSGDIWRFEPKDHKTAHRGRSRVVFIGPRAQELLLSYLLRDSESFCFSPAEVVAKQRAEKHAARKTPMSCGNRPGSKRSRRNPKRKAGERYTSNTYRRAIHRACDAADLKAHDADKSVKVDVRLVPRWAPNRLRHSMGTQARKEFGLEAAQVILGHAKANVTQVYAQADAEKAEAAIRQIG